MSYVSLIAHTLVGLANATAWPIALLVALALFRDDVKKLFPRIEKLGRDGLVLQPIPNSQNSDAALQPLSISYDFVDPAFHAIISQTQARLTTEIKEVQEKRKQPREVVLFDGLASALVAITFERIYHGIFGSQIKVLQQLLTSGDKAPIVDLLPLYEAAKQTAPPMYVNRDFDKWLMWMVKVELIKLEAGQACLMPAGHGFLAYLKNHQYSTNLLG